ncbi:MAG: DUF86 domain-containing protein [Deltaproteobacteria bacterium]|nr:DUF86 domain-containing protein [Deltaproteobacteria bacterium]
MEETLEYFQRKLEGVDRDRYLADRDIRNILDKTINDTILCLVDISEEILKSHQRTVPDTYRDTILACYEFLGESALKVAPLVKRRNETIHQYLKVNWQNIVTVRSKFSEIREFIEKARGL